jgi:hypothetical protein
MKKAVFCFLVIVFFINGRVVFSQDRPGAVRFLEVTGTVELQEAGSSTWAPAAAGMVIGKGTVISTGFKSTARISLENSTIAIRPLTRLTLEEIVQRGSGEEVSLYLRSGRVRADVTPPAGGNIDFTIRSPTATASVRGTGFDFNPPYLLVDDGQVRYTGVNGATANVNPGERSYIDEKENRVVPPSETTTTLFTPTLPELDSTGGNSASSPVIFPPVISLPSKGDMDVGFEWP